MPISGGSSTDAGVIFELWYAALQISEIYFNPELEVTPQAQFKSYHIVVGNGKTIEKHEIVHCDDLTTKLAGIYTHYNIKTFAPNDKGYWSIKDLIGQKVLYQFKKSFESLQKPNLVFISQNPCKRFKELINRAKAGSNPAKFLPQLTGKYEKEWNELKNYFEYDDDQLIQISKYISTEIKSDYKDIRKEITNKFIYQVNEPQRAASIIYDLAQEAAIWKLTINHNELLEAFKKGDIYSISAKNIRTIKDIFINASTALTSYCNHFKITNKNHLVRKETTKILEWIKSDFNNNKKNIMLLVGSAGSGKSTILKDVITELHKDNICALGIKSDQYMVNSKRELEDALSLTDGFDNIINTAAMKQKTVLIIDQIDALSQYLSTNKNSMKVYLNMIRQFQIHRSIKIIISCRNFDLEYDPMLIDLKESDKIVVSLLENEEINQVISCFGLKYEELPVDLQELLRIPLHLNIFCSIYKNEIKLSKFRTIQDLYHELWLQKISPQDNKIVELLFKISEKMSSEQLLSIPKYHYEFSYSKELHFLSHEGIIIVDGKNIQFFHQTFFDYTFACSFVENGRKLSEFVLHQHQGLFIRSSIIQIIEYYKSIGFDQYELQLGQLLYDSNIRYHIKHLVIYWFSKIISPSEIEKRIFDKYIFKDSAHFEKFIEMLSSSGWIKYLIEKDILIQLLKSPDSSLYKILKLELRYLMKENPNELLDFIKTISNEPEFTEVAANSLLGLEDWSNPLSFEIYDSLKEHYFSMDRKNVILFVFRYAIKYNPLWVLSHFHELVLLLISGQTLTAAEIDKIFGYNEIKLIKALFKAIPAETSTVLLSNVCELIKATKMNDFENTTVDRAFWGYHNDNHLTWAYWVIVDLLEEYGATYLATDKIKFKTFFKDYLETDSLTILGIIFSVFIKNPALFKKDIYHKILQQEFFNRYNWNSHLVVNAHKALSGVYPLLTVKQKKRLNKFILSYFPFWEKRKDNYKSIGNAQFILMKCIPEEELRKTDLHKRYLEYCRKFPVSRNVFENYGIIQSGFVGPPLPKVAYEKMTLKQWLTSFKVYDKKTKAETKIGRSFLTGGMSQHASMFKMCVKNNPDKFYNFIITLEKENVPIKYISEGIFGLKEADFNPQKLKSIVKLYALKYNDYNFRRDILFVMEKLVSLVSATT